MKLFEKIADHLIEKINTGQYGVGSELPPEVQLQKDMMLAEQLCVKPLIYW